MPHRSRWPHPRTAVGQHEACRSPRLHGRRASHSRQKRCGGERFSLVPMIGIGGRLTTPPLPHHLAYGSRTSAVRSG
jgi:hypothetical protein